jgi:hypothetical protein
VVYAKLLSLYHPGFDMKKNIFDEAAKKEIGRRVNQLTASSVTKWGVMNVSEMLHHLSASLREILHAHPSVKSSTARQKIMALLFLYVIPQFPKNARAPKTIDVKRTTTTVSDVEKEKQELLSLLDVFVMQQHVYAVHPYFGRLTRKQWGIFTWMHLDHHLRQFGA